MASKARSSFDRNVKDVDRLLELHADKGGKKQGRRFGLEVLNKSAIVLITAFWESYCEDIAAEGLNHIVAYAPSADDLPDALKRQIARELKDESHHLAIWKISDQKWRTLLTQRLEELQQDRNRKLNTPKWEQLDELFESAVGIERMSDSWKLSTRTSAAKARVKLNDFVTLRGNIAHRGTHIASVKKSDVVSYLDFVKALAAKTGGRVNQHVKGITGKPLWK